ncbi:MAG: DUF456 domain-containing protein [Planctomycetota bacterium]
MWELALTWTLTLLLWAGCLVGVVLVALQLPGTWLIVLLSALAAWWGWDANPEARWIGWWTLAALLALAVLGEIIEAIAGALGSRAAGGSRRGAVLAIVGGIAGALLGTVVIPVPIVGTLLGAAIGAGLLSGLGDKWAGRKWGEAIRGGSGAAVGKFAGSVVKLTIAGVMMGTVVVASLA